MTGLRFLLRVTLRRLDLASEVYHLREPQKIPLVMSPDETRRLLAVAGSLKVRVLLGLGYGCGLRAGEVVRLKVKHIDSAQKIIRVEQSKGRKDRNVMLSPETLDLLRQWWKVRPTRHDAQMLPQERWLFPGRTAGKPMTTRQLSRLFHEAADAAGIKKSVTLHALRHSFSVMTLPIKESFASLPLPFLYSFDSGSVLKVCVALLRVSSVKIALAVAAGRRRFARTVLRHKALHRSPRRDLRFVDREVFV